MVYYNNFPEERQPLIRSHGKCELGLRRHNAVDQRAGLPHTHGTAPTGQNARKLQHVAGYDFPPEPGVFDAAEERSFSPVFRQGEDGDGGQPGLGPHV